VLASGDGAAADRHHGMTIRLTSLVGNIRKQGRGGSDEHKRSACHVYSPGRIRSGHGRICRAGSTGNAIYQHFLPGQRRHNTRTAAQIRR